MDDLLHVIVDSAGRVLDNLVGRGSGPMKFRLILQPLMATIFAIRSGLADARTGNAPYFWSIFTQPSSRRTLLQQGWKDVGKIFVVAVLMDVVYQIIVLRWVYPGEALLTAALLAFVPYLLIRGVVTRIARK